MIHMRDDTNLPTDNTHRHDDDDVAVMMTMLMMMMMMIIMMVNVMVMVMVVLVTVMMRGRRRRRRKRRKSIRTEELRGALGILRGALGTILEDIRFFLMKAYTWTPAHTRERTGTDAEWPYCAKQRHTWHRHRAYVALTQR